MHVRSTGVSVTGIVGAKDYVPPPEEPKIEEIVEDPVKIAELEAAEAARVAAAAAKAPDPIPLITVKTSSSSKDFLAEFVIWAGGEFQYPKTIPHTVRPGKNYKQMPVGKHVICGGSESGMDAAYHLVKYGSEVTVLDESSTWTQRVSDSSYGLSPHTIGRVREMQASGKVIPHGPCNVLRGGLHACSASWTQPSTCCVVRSLAHSALVVADPGHLHRRARHFDHRERSPHQDPHLCAREPRDRRHRLRHEEERGWRPL